MNDKTDKAMEVTKILSCPFCGDYPPAPRIIKRTAKSCSGGYHYWVKHGWCGAEGGHGLTEQQAIDEWNHRNYMRPSECIWQQDEDGNWETSCRNIFIISEGTPAENDMAFCTYCGGKLITKTALDTEDEL